LCGGSAGRLITHLSECCGSQARARKTAGALHFRSDVEMVGCISNLKSSCRPSSSEGFPSKDHVSLWIDPTSGMWVALDEPYGHANNEPMVKARTAWITHNTLHLTKPAWAGLYYQFTRYRIWYPLGALATQNHRST
jgi:hypothetical protein